MATIMFPFRRQHFSQVQSTVFSFHISAGDFCAHPFMFCLWAEPRCDGACPRPSYNDITVNWLAQECVAMQGTGSEGRWHLKDPLCRAFSGVVSSGDIRAAVFWSWVIRLPFCFIYLTDSRLSSPWLVDESPLLPCNVIPNISCRCLTVKVFQWCGTQFGSAQVTTAQGKSARIVFFIFSIPSFIVI